MLQTIPCLKEPEKLLGTPKGFGVPMPPQGAAPNTSDPRVSNSPGWQHGGDEAYGWRQPAVRQSRQNVEENPCTLQQTELLTVVELAARLKCSPGFIYRRLNRSHPQYIPHIRLTPTDIRFNSQVIADLLPKSENASVSLGPSVQPGGIVGCTRHRDRKGSLLIRGKKRKLWLSQWPEGNKRMSHKLGWHDEMSRSQAERAHRQWMEKVNLQTELSGDSITLEGFFHHHYWDDDSQQYGDELLTKRPSVRRDMRSVMKHAWIPRFGSRNLNLLKTGELQGFLVSLVTTGQVGRQTAHKYKTYLSSLFSAAMRLETGVTHNPVRAIKLPSPGPQNSRRQLTLEEVVAIEQKLSDPRHRMIWKLLLWAGNRRGEIRGLRWRSVHWKQNSILVTESVWEGQSGLPKTKKGYRKIVLTTSQMEELKKYKDENYPGAGPDDWLFPGIHNRPIDLKRFMSTDVKPICEELGIKGANLHALRHLNNSMMLSEGVDVKTRMDRLGHVSENTNMIYSHVGDDTQLAASEAIERRLEEARKELESKKAGSQTPPSPLTVTLSVTPNQLVPVSN